MHHASVKKTRTRKSNVNLEKQSLRNDRKRMTTLYEAELISSRAVASPQAVKRNMVLPQLLFFRFPPPGNSQQQSGSFASGLDEDRVDKSAYMDMQHDC